MLETKVTHAYPQHYALNKTPGIKELKAGKPPIYFIKEERAGFKTCSLLRFRRILRCWHKVYRKVGR